MAGTNLMRAFKAAGILCVCVSALASVPARADEFKLALRTAYETNPQILGARARLNAAELNVPIAWTQWLPQVFVAGTYGDQRSEQKFDDMPDRTITGEPYGLNATLTQEVFKGGQIIAEIGGARAGARAAQADFVNAEQNILRAAATAYLNVVRDRAVVRLNENNLVVLGQQLDTVQRRFDVGELTRSDVAVSRARLAEGRSLLARAQTVLTQSRAAYVRVIGLAPPRNIRLPALPRLPKARQKAVDMARRYNPVLRSARHNQDVARYNVRSAWARLLPSVRIEGQYNFTRNPLTGEDQTRSSAIIGRVTVPLFFGQALPAIQQTRWNAEQARLASLDAEREVLEAISNAWGTLTTTRVNIRADIEQETANKIALDAVREEVRVGVRTVLDVLDAERDLLDARVSLANARRDEQVAAYNLLAAMGALRAVNLKLFDTKPPAKASPKARRTNGNARK